MLFRSGSLVPLKLYWKSGKVKVLLGVGHGKKSPDKRQDLKRKDSEREMKRALSDARKGR